MDAVLPLGTDGKMETVRRYDLVESLRSYRHQVMSRLGDGAPVDYNIREDTPLDRLRETIRRFTNGEGGSICTFTVCNPETFDAVDQVPEQLRKRVLALRTWDADDMMVGHTVVDGREIEGAIEQLFADPRAKYMHAHFAGPGCYAALIDRA